MDATWRLTINEDLLSQGLVYHPALPTLVWMAWILKSSFEEQGFFGFSNAYNDEGPQVYLLKDMSHLKALGVCPHFFSLLQVLASL